MNKPLALLATLCGAIALPALAQMSPAQTNQDPRAARMETRNARGGQLTAVSSDQALANALRRCANLPPFYKSDCEARVKGEGQVSGTVVGGGMVKESVTTLPKDELDSMLQNQPPMTLPMPRQ